jgi:hypothetical protein
MLQTDEGTTLSIMCIHDPHYMKLQQRSINGERGVVRMATLPETKGWFAATKNGFMECAGEHSDSSHSNLKTWQNSRVF